MAVQLGEHTKNRSVVRVNWANCGVCESHLNKPVMRDSWGSGTSPATYLLGTSLRTPETRLSNR